jgi:S-DNA-T family DNA segregation ATPase FtsK/SpoIIIE
MRRRYRRDRFDPVLSRGIIAVILFILAIIITLSFFGKAGTVGVVLDEWILSFLFGSIRYASPFIIAILGWFLIKDIEYNYKPTHLIGTALFFLSLSSLMHINFDSAEMFNQAIEGHGGGIFGMLAWPMKEYLGIIAGSVLLVGLAIVGFLLIFNTSIAHFIMFHRKFTETLGIFGKFLTATTQKLFVKQNNINDEGELDENEDDEDAQDEETEGKRKFFSKQIAEDENPEETEDSEENPSKNASRANNQAQQSSPWKNKVIIKDLPPLSLLSNKRGKPTSGDIKANAEIIQNTLNEFGIEVAMGDVRVGPTVTQYTLKPSKGIKLSKITGLSNDLALALAAHPIRIEAPIPGKALVGVEVPNQKAALVTILELLESREFKNRDHNMMIALGKDVAGKVWFADLPKMPHLLIAGATGSGKTVCVNTIITSLLYQNTAETLRFIMIDPKRVELTLYNGIPHLLTPVITNVSQTVNALKWTIGEMERRFEMLAKSGSRDLASYNKKKPNDKMPNIVFVIDELADLMAAAANEVEAGIIRLAQMARAVGIHLILATQRPSVDVITGLMKANIPARIAFSVASIIDSRTILDCPGAEKLLGRGDMLFSTAELSKPVRIQASFIDEEEMKNVVTYLKGDETPEYDTSIIEKNPGATPSMFGGPADDQDEMFEEAKRAILESGKASASFLQRRLRLGYARAARILDELEEAGIIGPSQGAKPREILVSKEEIFETSMGAGQQFNYYNDNRQKNNDEELLDDEDEEESEEQNEDADDENNNVDELFEEQEEKTDEENEENNGMEENTGAEDRADDSEFEEDEENVISEDEKIEEEVASEIEEKIEEEEENNDEQNDNDDQEDNKPNNKSGYIFFRG